MSYTNPSPDSGPRVTRDQMRDISTLRRASDNRMVAGVAEGLSRHFDVDPLIIRVLFGALTLFGGAGIVLYVIAWVTIPSDDRHDSPLSNTLRRDPARVMVAGLTIAAVVAVATMVGAIGFSAPNPFPVVLISLVAIAIFAIFSRRTERPAPGHPPMPPIPPMEPATPQQPPSPAFDAPAAPTATTAAPPEAASSPIAPPAPPRAWWQRPAMPTGGGSYPPPGSYFQPQQPPPPRPARQPRGHLLSLTLGIIAIAMGVVWILDEAVFDDLPASAYPGTALGITAAALILGGWFGRSRTLIVVGFVATLATIGAEVAGPGPYGERIYRPATAAAVHADYDHGVGRMVIHLENVADIDALDGRSIDIDQRIGQLEIVVPSSLAVTLHAHVDHGEIDGPDRADVSDLDDGAEDVVMTSVPRGGEADLDLDLSLDFGQIVITQFNCPGTGAALGGTGLDTTSQSGVINAAPACN